MSQVEIAWNRLGYERQLEIAGDLCSFARRNAAAAARLAKSLRIRLKTVVRANPERLLDGYIAKKPPEVLANVLGMWFGEYRNQLTDDLAALVDAYAGRERASSTYAALGFSWTPDWGVGPGKDHRPRGVS